jgi:hypothetical protein
MSATHALDSTPPRTRTLYLAFELGWTTWNLGFNTGMGRKPRLRSMPARNLALLHMEIQRAQERFGLPHNTPVVSCYEAGRDGFWLHRWLIDQGIHNHVVDAASIEVNRPRAASQERCSRRHEALEHVDPLPQRRARPLERHPRPHSRGRGPPPASASGSHSSTNAPTTPIASRGCSLLSGLRSS